MMDGPEIAGSTPRVDEQNLRHFQLEELRALVDDPSTSFEWAPRVPFSSPNLQGLHGRITVHGGMPLVVTDVLHGEGRSVKAGGVRQLTLHRLERGRGRLPLVSLASAHGPRRRAHAAQQRHVC